MGTEGLEPSRLAPADFKSTVSTNFTMSPIITKKGLYRYLKKKQYNVIVLGGTQIRTGDRGFAIHCLTTWLYRRFNVAIYHL